MVASGRPFSAERLGLTVSWDKSVQRGRRRGGQSVWKEALV